MLSSKEKYEKEISPALQKELGIKNKHLVPRIVKVVVNAGLGRASQKPSFQDKILPEIIANFSAITGQKPSPRPAKKSIAGFKLREGSVVGLKSTLRGNRAYDFVDKVIKIVFPRLRDFKGISLKNVDKQGNLNLGFKENFAFSEINQESINFDFGFQITVTVQARNRDEAVNLYRKLGFLFKKNG